MQFVCEHVRRRAACATGCDRLVSADCGCLLNITGRAAKQDELAGRDKPSLDGEHIASFLWQRTNPARADAA